MNKFSTYATLLLVIIVGAFTATAGTYKATDVERPPYGAISTSKVVDYIAKEAGYTSKSSDSISMVPDYIADPDEILNWRHRLEVDNFIKATREATGLDVAVVIVQDVEGDVKAFAKDLYKQWNMGSRVSSDNGVLVVVVRNRGGVGHIYAGPGTLTTLPRTALSKIEQKKMTPALRDHNFAGAITSAMEYIQKVKADPKAAEAELDAAPSAYEDMNLWWIGGILLACIVIAIVMKIRRKKKGNDAEDTND